MTHRNKELLITVSKSLQGYIFWIKHW